MVIIIKCVLLLIMLVVPSSAYITKCVLVLIMLIGAHNAHIAHIMVKFYSAFND